MSVIGMFLLLRGITTGSILMSAILFFITSTNVNFEYNSLKIYASEKNLILFGKFDVNESEIFDILN